MNLDPPRQGWVIRYSYLWEDEASAGREDGRKDRPVVVLTLAVRTQDGRTEVLALPITHSAPTNATDAVQIPERVKGELGLDDQSSFIVTFEGNRFLWPGQDLRAVPRRTPPTVLYGRLPEDLVRKVADQFLANRKRGGKLVRRT